MVLLLEKGEGDGGQQTDNLIILSCGFLNFGFVWASVYLAIIRTFPGAIAVRLNHPILSKDLAKSAENSRVNIKICLNRFDCYVISVGHAHECYISLPSTVYN